MRDTKKEKLTGAPPVADFLELGAAGELVRLAREEIEASVRRRPFASAERLDEACRRHPVLSEARGAFVTIYVSGQLRGCLGEIDPEEPLLEVVLRCARRVPLHDYRFDPVQPAELSRLTFKISVLTPPRLVENLSDIQIGRDGLIVRDNGRAGLLLPEVPQEYGWDLATFLKHLWQKAGIPAGVPAQQVQLWSFSSQIISSPPDD